VQLGGPKQGPGSQKNSTNQLLPCFRQQHGKFQKNSQQMRDVNEGETFIDARA
jgi:hypothetical protein